MRTIIIIAPWSSGSTAIAGFLHHCGAYTCPPHQHTDDNLTPNSYEPLHYAEALRDLFDEFTLQKKGSMEEFKNFFEHFFSQQIDAAQNRGFSSIALKHPLQTFVLPYLNSFLSPKYILVTRPLKRIESTRRRRNWHPVYGEVGAEQIYRTAANFLLENSCPYLAIPYNALLSDNCSRQYLLDFCDLTPSNEALQQALDFLRR